MCNFMEFLCSDLWLWVTIELEKRIDIFRFSHCSIKKAKIVASAANSMIDLNTFLSNHISKHISQMYAIFAVMANFEVVRSILLRKERALPPTPHIKELLLFT